MNDVNTPLVPSRVCHWVLHQWETDGTVPNHNTKPHVENKKQKNDEHTMHTSSSMRFTTSCNSFLAAELLGSIFNSVSKSTILSSYRCSICMCTLHLKKCPNFKLVSNFIKKSIFKTLHCWKAYEICYKSLSILPTSPYTLLHYLWKLKIQIFCRYSAYTEENANKLHFECTDFNSSMHVTVWWVYLCIYYLVYLQNIWNI